MAEMVKVCKILLLVPSVMLDEYREDSFAV